MWRVASSVPYLRRISASAIAALAKDRIVRIADIGIAHSEGQLCGQSVHLQPRLLLTQKTLAPAAQDFRQRGELPVCGHSGL